MHPEGVLPGNWGHSQCLLAVTMTLSKGIETVPSSHRSTLDCLFRNSMGPVWGFDILQQQAMQMSCLSTTGTICNKDVEPKMMRMKLQRKNETTANPEQETMPSPVPCFLCQEV